MDVVVTRKEIVDELNARGFFNYGADPSDFGKDDHPVRFKVGTTPQEITLSAWVDSKQVEVQRIFRREQLEYLIVMIAKHDKNGGA